MKTGWPLDERSFEQLLAAAYLLQQQQQSEAMPFSGKPSARDEAARLAAIAEAHTIVHGSKLRLQETLRVIAERAVRITSAAGAAIWLLRGSNAICQAACGVSLGNAGQSISVEGSRLAACLREGAIFRCDDAKADPRMRYDALPGTAQGSSIAVPIRYDGMVQGALEVTFAQARGFDDADVRTCQILSGLVSETVAVAAGQERENVLESERATLLEALDRIQPHLSKLLSDSGAEVRENDEQTASAADVYTAPTGPTHGMARLGKFLVAQQEQGADASTERTWENGKAPNSPPREVRTALNLSVASKRNSPEADSWSAHEDVPLRARAAAASPAESYNFEEQPHYEHATELVERESNLITLPHEPWLDAEMQAPVQAAPVGPVQGFWQLHFADVCLAASMLLLAATLTWAVWPRSGKPAAPGDPATATAPKLTPFEELLVAMGLAEAPPPPATYTGAPATRVWVDLHNALYYCPGAEPYGKTPKGKFMTQHDAQDEQYQPARGQPCD